MSNVTQCPICGNKIFPKFDYSNTGGTNEPRKVWFECRCGLRTPDMKTVEDAFKELECTSTTSMK